jgi:carbonyl reductase 1
VTSQDSINAAAASLESEKPFHAVINNAGAGLAHGVGPKDILDVNIYGAKHVNDAFIPLVNPNGGRLIGTSSGLASSYVSGKFSGNDLGRLPMKEREPLKSFDVTWEQIQTILDKEAELGYGEGDQGASMCAYGLSKACLTAYYMLLAKQYPNLITATVSPGFINTKMTQGFGASLQPEQGTISLRKCTLEPLTDCKGWYFGSDGLRSPLDVMRNPGDPEYNP